MTAEIIYFDPKAKKVEPVCAFCSSPKSHVKHLISNNKEGIYEKYLCDSCISKLTKLITPTDNLA
jgi:transposase-like protein